MSDDRLEQRAIAAGWTLSDSQKSAILARLMEVITPPDRDGKPTRRGDRQATAAARALAQLAKLALEEAKLTPRAADHYDARTICLINDQIRRGVASAMDPAQVRQAEDDQAEYRRARLESLRESERAEREGNPPGESFTRGA